MFHHQSKNLTSRLFSPLKQSAFSSCTRPQSIHSSFLLLAFNMQPKFLALPALLGAAYAQAPMSLNETLSSNNLTTQLAFLLASFPSLVSGLTTLKNITLLAVSQQRTKEDPRLFLILVYSPTTMRSARFSIALLGNSSLQTLAKSRHCLDTTFSMAATQLQLLQT